MLSTEMPKDKCPFCDYKVDCASAIKGKNKPSEGDVSLCLSCAQILIFGKGLKLRVPTQEEYIEASNMKSLKEMQVAIRKIDRRGVGAKRN